jgi:hypothetical protein
MLMLPFGSKAQIMAFDLDSVMLYCTTEDMRVALYKNYKKEKADKMWADLPLYGTKSHDTLYCTETTLWDFDFEVADLLQKRKMTFFDARSGRFVKDYKRRKETDVFKNTWWMYYDPENEDDLYLVEVFTKVKF